MSARLRIQALLRRGFSKASVARTTGVSLRSVKRIAKEPELSQTTDVEERRRRGIGRPSIVRPFKSFVLDVLRADPEIRSAEILRRARERGYPGGKSALYALISSLREESARSREVIHERRGLGVRAGSVSGTRSARADTEGLP